MKVVTVAPRHHQLFTTFAVVPPNGDSREFVFAADCPFREQRTAVVFEDKEVADFVDPHRHGPSSLNATTRLEGFVVEFDGRHGHVRQPLHHFLLWSLGGGIDWGFPRPFQRVSIRVTNESSSPLSVAWRMEGVGVLPVVPPPPRGNAPIVPADDEKRIEAIRSAYAEVGDFLLMDREKLRVFVRHAMQTSWRGMWHERPEPVKMADGRAGVHGHWWRVRKSDGAWDVCEFDVEPVPEDARAYEWKRYSP